MSGIDIGCNFSNVHTDTILKLVAYQKRENTPNKIKGVYGTPRGEANPFGSTRPRGRETEVEEAVFIDNIRELRDNGIEINMTINMLWPYVRGEGSEANPMGDTRVRQKFLRFVDKYDSLITNWIIAHPYLLELMHGYQPTHKAGIILSTIMNIHSLAQLEYIRDRWPRVKRVCPALWMNRKFDWLKLANKIIPLELLANEFCSIGGAECDGLYRQACYLSQCLESPWNPMQTACIHSRRDNPKAWLMARFILPQWLETYRHETHVCRFKVTGRTHTAEYIEYIGKAYLDGRSSGNLLQLWGQLEAALNKENWKAAQGKAVDATHLKIEDIEDCLPMFKDCDITTCGVLCKKCEGIVESITNE